MVTQLAIVEIDGKKYFDDLRLQQYRHVKDITDWIDYDQLGDRKVRLIQERRALTPDTNVRKRQKGRGL